MADSRLWSYFGDNTYGSIDIAMPDIVSIEEVKINYVVYC